MISEETVAHVAKLARLELTSNEIQAYSQDLSKILHLVDELSELDLANVQQGLNTEAPALLRADEVQKAFSREVLMTNAPQEESFFFRVPKILDEGN